MWSLVAGSLLLLLSGWAVVHTFWYVLRLRLYARLPAPPSCGLVTGHVAALTDPRHHRTLLRWDALVGPLFCLRVMWAHTVVITHPAHIHQLLRATNRVDKSLVTYQAINPLLSDKSYPSLFSASTHSPYWRLVRKGVAPGFSMTCLRGSFRRIQDSIAEVLGTLERLGPEEAFDVDSLLCRFTTDVIGRVGFDAEFGAVQGFRGGSTGLGGGHASGHGGPKRGGVQGEEEGQDIFTVINASMEEVNKQWANPMRSRLWWLPEVRAARRHWRLFQGHMRQLAEDVRSRGPPADSDHSIAAHLLRLRDPQTGQPLSVDRLIPEISTFFVAGMDTTAHTMAWTLLLVAQHPEVEAKLCAELDALGLLATHERPQPRAVQWEDCGKLSYLGATVKESMRVLPVGADGTAVQLPRDFQLGSYTIPALTPIWVHMFTTHNSPRYWAEPERFLPERFLVPGAEHASAGPLGDAQKQQGQEGQQEGQEGQQQGKQEGQHQQGKHEGQQQQEPEGQQQGHQLRRRQPGAAPADGRTSFESGNCPAGDATAAGIGRAAAGGAAGGEPLRFFPFSQGPRDCVGQSLARLNYTAALASLLGRFTFRLSPQSAGAGSVRDVVKLTLQPDNGIFMYALPRVKA